jgi:hypothetical protein
MIFDNDRIGRRQHAMLHKVMLVVVEDEGIVTEKTVASNDNQFVRGNRRSVVDEGVVSNRNASAFVSHELDRHDVANQGDAVAKD